MDIVTHGMMGAILASPFFESSPEAAAAFMFGSVLPDLDAVSRVLGKRAFLRSHQTYTHSFPVIAAIGALAWLAGRGLGLDAPWAPLALALGMTFHTALDWTNTYGITLFAPFSRRRFCREWVFFIDAFVIAATVATLLPILVRWRRGEPLGFALQAVYALVLVAYWIAKVALRARALRACPEGTLALLPSALFPWTFLGCCRDGALVRAFRVYALSGRVEEEERVDVLDGSFLAAIEGVPEFRAMRELSPAYHVVLRRDEPAGVRLLCRDLRTRNFSTRFGELELALDAAGRVRDVVFHV